MPGHNGQWGAGAGAGAGKGRVPAKGRVPGLTAWTRSQTLVGEVGVGWGGAGQAGRLKAGVPCSMPFKVQVPCGECEECVESVESVESVKRGVFGVGGVVDNGDPRGEAGRRP